MNNLTTLPDPTSTLTLKTLLSQEGVRCHLVELTAGEKLSLGQECRRLVFVLQGEITCSRGAVNTIVNAEEAMLTSAERASSLEARNGDSARVLVVELPGTVEQPEIRTFDR